MAPKVDQYNIYLLRACQIVAVQAFAAERLVGIFIHRSMHGSRCPAFSRHQVREDITPLRANACVARLGNQGGCLEGITGFAQRQIDRISGQYQEVADSCLVRDRDGNFTSGLLSWLEVMRVRGHAFASSVFPVA